MKIINGQIVYDDVFELTFAMMMAIGIKVKPDGTLEDDDLGNIIHVDGKALKVNTDSRNIKYAGQGEVVLDPLNDMRIMTTLLGYCIDKKQKLDDMPFISYYSEEIEDPNNGVKLSNLILKYGPAANDIISTKYYCNKCIKFIELIFMIEEFNVNLGNFDVIELPNKRKSKAVSFRTES